MFRFRRNKKAKEDTPDAEMSFWDHLEALRWHLIRSVIAILVFTTLGLIFKDFLFDTIILAPKRSDFITNRILCWLGQKINIDYFCVNDFNLKLINTEMAGQFTTYMNVSIVAGLILAIPFILWEIWKFIKPALKEKEIRYSKSFVLVTSVLFFSGVLFAYFVVVPMMVNFLGKYKVSESVDNYINLGSYIGTVTNLTFAVGCIFEFPVLVYFLTKVGILNPAFLRKYRRHIIVLILIIAAIITPPDMFSQILVSIPLYGLYEMSIYISQRIYNKRKREEEAVDR
ncbi:MAG: twin-arginine translocase subunit TatC [Bacteroidales bacterium]|jgi:sec-independent protein translocase protein TatC